MLETIDEWKKFLDRAVVVKRIGKEFLLMFEEHSKKYEYFVFIEDEFYHYGQVDHKEIPYSTWILKTFRDTKDKSLLRSEWELYYSGSGSALLMIDNLEIATAFKLKWI